jgi:NAD(P)-dependent dehydrogenase (short-subunit alcohol dehydrogenase family)
VAFGLSAKEASIVSDIARHTLRAIQWGEALGGWRALREDDVFAVEYWELEQAKLQKPGSGRALQGKVALVSGAAGGIGRAFAELLHLQGAAVVGLDVKPEIAAVFDQIDLVGHVCDVTDRAAVQEAVKAAVRRFGGLDIVVSNAGIFPASQAIAEMESETWEKSLEVNLSSHQRLLQACIPYLVQGLDPAIVIVGSKNVTAPGPGAGAYSVAKAGLTQLARVAALELASAGVRVNTIHPHGVFDTGLWTEDVLAERAAHYGMSVEEYKTSNLLGVQVTARDVALLGCALVGPAFAKTTGAQIPVDGGSDRVI